MAGWNRHGDTIMFGIELSDATAKFEIKDGYLEVKMSTEGILEQVPHLHNYFNAEEAIKRMPADELEKLRLLIAPEVDRLNLEMQDEMATINRENWERFNKLRDAQQEKTKELQDTITMWKKRHEESEAGRKNISKSFTESERELSKAQEEIRTLKHQLESVWEDVDREFRRREENVWKQIEFERQMKFGRKGYFSDYEGFE